MAISSLGSSARTIVQMTATNTGFHSFSPGTLSGFLAVRSTDPVTVILGRASSSAATLSGASGTDFSVGADTFDTILVYVNNVGTEVVIDYTPVTSSTSTTTPTWLSYAAYTWTNNVASNYTQSPTKILFPVDTVSVSNALPSGRYQSAGTANSGVAGYMFGGFTAAAGVAVNSIDQYTFPSDTSSTIVATLDATKYSHVAYSNSGTAAYVTNGYRAGVFADTAIQKFAYTAMTRTILAGVALARGFSCSFVNGHAYGYIAGGASGTGAAAQFATVRKHDYSNDTLATTAGVLSLSGQWCWMAAAGHIGTMAVYSGSVYASDSTVTSSYDMTYLKYWQFSTDTQATSVLRFQKPTTLTYGGYGGGNSVQANPNVATYFSGGVDSGAPVAIATIEKVTMPNLTTSVVNLVNGNVAGAGFRFNGLQSFENTGVF